MRRPRAWLVTPAVLLLIGLAPPLLGIRNFHRQRALASLALSSPERPGASLPTAPSPTAAPTAAARASVPARRAAPARAPEAALGLSLLWLCLMAWLALSRLRMLEPRPALRDAVPGSRAERLDVLARQLAAVSAVAGTVLVPIGLALAGRATLVAGASGGPALVGVVVGLVALIGALRAVRALALLGRPAAPVAPLAGLGEGLIEVSGVVTQADDEGFVLRDDSTERRLAASGVEVVTAEGRTVPIGPAMSVRITALAQREGDPAGEHYRSNQGTTLRLVAPPGGQLLVVEEDQTAARRRTALFVGATAVVVASVLAVAGLAAWGSVLAAR